jgi:hypothetical protein
MGVESSPFQKIPERVYPPSPEQLASIKEKLRADGMMCLVGVEQEIKIDGLQDSNERCTDAA